TDSFPAHGRAIREVFKFKVKQDRFLSFKQHNNNQVENFFRCKKYFPRLRKLEVARKHVAYWLREYEEMKGISKIFYFIINLLCKTIKWQK
ncbi:MAG: hypothetical protein QMD14_02005, partial [Candidatus Aenigmarchaeota archaeon]|nr:hypothetical protein [Candidatus Aenigmarchaeota archaeon]